MKRIKFVLAFILLTTISGLAQDKYSETPKKYVIDGITIVVTREKVFATKLGKKIWEDSTFAYHYPQQSEIIARKFLIIRGCISGGRTLCTGSLLNIRTGQEIKYIRGDTLLRYQNTFYFDNVLRGWDDNQIRSFWGSMSLLKFDTNSMKFEELNIVFREELVPTSCIDPELSNSLQYFSFKARKNMIWYYEYKSKSCKVSLYFAEKDLIAKVNIKRKK